MSLQPLLEWIQQTPVSTTIRSSRVLIAAVEGVHLVGLALLLGTILMVDMSLLGRGIRRVSTAEIARALAGWTIAGLVVMLISGPLMFTSEAFRCYKTPAFWVKMVLLAAALVFHFRVHQKTALAEPPVALRRSRLVGAASLALWTSVALAAKAIAIFPGNTEGRF
ncbi:MAG TPA: DUF6644 family protein [Bryobacteraceae bacterium]|nr:DUF6644 family protein [Bryobacteraceae bacterium]